MRGFETEFSPRHEHAGARENLRNGFPADRRDAPLKALPGRHRDAELEPAPHHVVASSNARSIDPMFESMIDLTIDDTVDGATDDLTSTRGFRSERKRFGRSSGGGIARCALIAVFGLVSWGGAALLPSTASAAEARSEAATVAKKVARAASTNHPAHVSFAEIDWNPKTKSFECALRLDGAALESALRRESDKPVDLEKTKNVDTLITEWLDTRFEIIDAKKTVRPLTWVGKEFDGAEVWIYFEIAGRGKPEEHRLGHRLFFETEAMQIHCTTIRAGKKAKSLIFSPRSPELSLSFLR